MAPGDQTNLTAHPTLLQRVGLDYYHKPTNPFAQYIWRTKVWVGATFVMGMLEPLEVLALGIVCSLLTALFYLSLYKYFPAHFEFLRRRSAYYLYGDEMTPVFTLTPAGVIAKWRSLVEWVLDVLRISNSQEKEQAAMASVADVAKAVTRVIIDTAGAVIETAKAEL